MISLHFASVLFDPAAVMPRDGEPTKIDFADKFAVACILPSTNCPTAVEPVALQRTREGTLRLICRVSRRQSASYVMRPSLLLEVSLRYANLPFEAVEMTD